MRELLAHPMSPKLAWILGVVLLSAGGIYCVVYSAVAGRPATLGVGLSWAFVSLVPWLIAFEMGKRVNSEPTGTWKANWSRIAAIMLVTAVTSVTMEDWLWEDGHISVQEAILALLRRILPALIVCVLLFLMPTLQQDPETGTGTNAPVGFQKLPLPPNQIDWIKAGGNYLDIRAGDRLILHRMTMASAEALLKDHRFIRVHRSALVNARRVKKLYRGKVADEILLDDGTRLKVGRTYRAHVYLRFGGERAS